MPGKKPDFLPVAAECVALLATQVARGYNDNLPERTKVFAFATRIGNKQSASCSFLNDAPNGAGNSSIALCFRDNF